MIKLPVFFKRKAILSIASIWCSNMVFAAEPTVISEFFTITADTELTVSATSLLSNDRGENGTGILEIEFLDDWVNGYANYNRETGNITFTPTVGFSGTGSFTYTVSDGLERGWGFVTITIEESETEIDESTASDEDDSSDVVQAEEYIQPDTMLAPTIENETFSISANTTLETSATALLANDRGENGTGVLRIESLDDWVNGVASYDSNTGVITFVPDTDFVGTGTFTYKVSDGVEINWGFVTILVEESEQVVSEDSIQIESEVSEEAEEQVTTANAVEKSSIRQFTFNHSLWDHWSTSHTNTVTGYWVGEFALASGTTYAWNGQFGQLDYHSLPPFPQLGSTNSSDVFPSEDAAFSSLSLDNVLIMPPNYVQSGTVSAAQKEITDAQRVIDYIIDPSAGNYAGIPVYIYEHWPEAASDILDESQWRAYHEQTTGDYHQWFLDYQNQLAGLYPQIDFRMIPVGPIIAEILQNTSLQVSSLSFSDLYEDNSPHGTTNLYFLAGLITYQAMYGQVANSQYQPPVDSFSGVDSAIASEFSEINDFVWQRLNYYNSNGVRIWPES